MTNRRREKYAKKFRLKGCISIRLPNYAMDQLDLCVDDMARRILLGTTKKFTKKEQAAMSQ